MLIVTCRGHCVHADHRSPPKVARSSKRQALQTIRYALIVYCLLFIMRLREPPCVNSCDLQNDL